jgi:Plasmid pRiA4b ORF-3-like protein
MSLILELDITLKSSKPKIWRRVHVPSSLTFHKLHEVIQKAMGWHDYHLYVFELDRYSSIGIPSDDDWEEVIDSRKLKIGDYFQQVKDKIVYEYDFGDSWEHNVVLKKMLDADPNVTYPIVTAGAMACPPEDCGGIWGYTELLDVIKDPSDEKHEDILEWLGGEFDPGYFNLEELNKVHFKQKKRK